MLKGVISCFKVRTPTEAEINNCRQVVLTADNTWEPNSRIFEELEEVVAGRASRISAVSIDSVEESDLLMMTIDEQQRQVSLVEQQSKKLFLKEDQLAMHWAIGIKDAAMTVKVTTQRLFRSALHPVERHFRTKNMTLRYNHLS